MESQRIFVALSLEARLQGLLFGQTINPMVAVVARNDLTTTTPY